MFGADDVRCVDRLRVLAIGGSTVIFGWLPIVSTDVWRLTRP
jgi:hypothetical protein